MSISVQPFWPYEQRFELYTDMPLTILGSAVWERTAELAGATIIKEGRSPSCRHFILSMSSLLVFERRIVLLSCAPRGIMPAAEFLLDAVSTFGPRYATLERRLPLGSAARGMLCLDFVEQHLPPVSLESAAAVIHTWPIGPAPERASTLVVLMHELRGECDLETAKGLLSSYFPNLLVAGKQFDATGFSFNAVGHNDYITMHYSGGLYASLECSFESSEAWDTMDALLEEILAECNPEIVAPMWHGQSIPDVSAAESSSELRR
jgi:hypothetical protein